MFGIVSLIIAIAIITEIVYCLSKGMTPTDVTYYMCRPFGWSMKLKWGLIIRILLLLLSGAMLALGLVSLL